LTLQATRALPKDGEALTMRPVTWAVCGFAAFAPVFALAAAQGGYFPTAWGWATLPLLWAIVIALLVRPKLTLSDRERVFVTLLAAFAVWIVVSTAWSVAPAETVLEFERAVVYVAAVAAILLLSRRRYSRYVLGAVLTAISLIATFSLATRLFPDRIGVYDQTAVYRLSQPIGYWNGLAIFTAIGAILAFAFAGRARTIAGRTIGAAALVILLPTFYFTFGRAGWIALAVGVVATILVDPRRLQFLSTLIVVGAAPALAVWLASREAALTHRGSSLARAAHDGHRLALALLVLALINALAAAALAAAERHVVIGNRGRRAFATVTALFVAAALTLLFVRYGNPVTLTRKAYAAFQARPPHASAAASNLNRRLLSFSGNGRADLWRLAWDDAGKHPLFGTGAGTYERYFLAHQPALVGRVRDAHGLYIETLAELGPFGLALLVGVLVIPFTALGAARSSPLVPGALGAYVAYLVHAGVDWDWELPAVTLAGLVCGASILLAARSPGSRSLSPATRWTSLAAVILVALFAAIGLAGNAALSRSESAREHRDWVHAADEARRARFWMPWSPTPREALGRAEVGAGVLPAARRSFREALALDRGDWHLWYDLAGATSGRARTSALEHAAKLFPRSGLSPRTVAKGATP
jgi:O-Antigen ligase